jgi:hypothetical protein
LVGEGCVAGGDAEHGAEGGVPGAAAIESEDELVEVGLELLAAQAVIDAQGPDLEVGEDAVHPGQHDVGRHLADDVRIVADAGSAGIGGPSVGLGKKWRRSPSGSPSTVVSRLVTSGSACQTFAVNLKVSRRPSARITLVAKEEI